MTDFLFGASIGLVGGAVIFALAYLAAVCWLWWERGRD